MNKCVKVLVSLDFLSPEIGFEFNGSSHYKSFAGGIYSTIIILINIAITIAFSSSLYLKDDPWVINFQEVPSSSIVKFNDFPMTMSFSDIYSLKDAYKELFTIDLVLFKINKDLTFNRTIYTDILEKCEREKFNYLDENIIVDSYNNFTTGGVFCIKQFKEDIYFSNSYGASNSSFTNIRVSACDPEKNKNCPSNIKQVVNNIIVGFQHPTSFYNSQDYDKPVKYRIKTYPILISFGLIKRLFINIVNNRFISDEGWIFSSDKNFNNFSFFSDSMEINLTSDNNLLWIVLSSPKISNITKRSYIKIQDLISNIGGFSSILLILLQFITKSHLRFNYLTFIRQLALEDDKNFESALNASASPIRFQVSNKKTVKQYKQESKLNNSKNKEDIIKNNVENMKPKQNENIKKIQSNNFVETTIQRKRTIDNHLHSEIRFNYFFYICSIVFCNKKKSQEYDIIFANTKMLISISAFSKLMTFQFNSIEEREIKRKINYSPND